MVRFVYHSLDLMFLNVRCFFINFSEIVSLMILMKLASKEYPLFKADYLYLIYLILNQLHLFLMKLTLWCAVFIWSIKFYLNFYFLLKASSLIGSPIPLPNFPYFKIDQPTSLRKQIKFLIELKV